ncbi:MAG: leucine-rich repeat domain-containing protein, partial [Bacteroidota bacterium]
KKKNIQLACELAKAIGSIEGFRPYELLTDPEDKSPLIKKVVDLLKKEVDFINLSYKGLTTFPEVLFQFPAIQYLSLNNNQLKSLPKQMSVFEELVSLDLNHNQFDAVPQAIFSLGRLEELFISHNALVELPSEIVQLISLQCLFVGNNQISNLPTALSRLESLECLHLENNRFTHWPAVLNELDLKSLSLRGNTIKEVPDPFDIASYEILDFSYNPIEKLNFIQTNICSFLETVEIEGTRLSVKNIKKIKRILEGLEDDHIHIPTPPWEEIRRQHSFWFQRE